MRVSCLMVTQPGREHLADGAVADFLAQAWRDRELVIVSDGTDAAHIDWLKRARDRVAAAGHRVVVGTVAAPMATTLGALRNRAVDLADGDFALQWDDDDRYHPDRIAIQAAPLVLDPALAGTCLTSQLYWLEPDRRLYWVDWHRRRPRYESVRIPGTLCVRTAVVLAEALHYPEEGAVASRGEDGAFLRDVVDCGPVEALPPDLGWCYLRRYHGGNTWGRDRFESNARWLGLASDEIAMPARRAAIGRALIAAGIDGPVHVTGRDGPAYTLSPPGGDAGDGPA